MKRHKPKPVVLEPASVSLLRLGREMGANDVPAAELVSSPLWSAEASREVDRILGRRERRERDQVEDDLRRGRRRTREGSLMIRIVAIYHAPFGAPAPFLVQPWDFEAGSRPVGGDMTYAASLEQARDSFPRDGLEAHPPRPIPTEAKGLIETWEPKR